MFPSREKYYQVIWIVELDYARDMLEIYYILLDNKRTCNLNRTAEVIIHR